MSPALVILLYAFVLVVILLIAFDPREGGRPDDQERSSGGSVPDRHYAMTEDSAGIEPLDHWHDDAGSRIGDHVITSQSDMSDFDSFSDSWGDTWGHDD